MIPAKSANPSRGGEHRPAAPAISPPKGGDAIRGMGEKAGANPVTDTRSMTVPITTIPGRAGFGPELSLSHGSGPGNGPFGFGWALSLPAITPKTDTGLRQNQDAKKSDAYLISGAEHLAPVLAVDGTRFQDDTTDPGFVVHRYRLASTTPSRASNAGRTPPPRPRSSLFMNPDFASQPA